MHRDVVATTTQILRDLDFDLPWQDLDRDVRNILRSLAEARPEIRRPAGLDVEILESIFYRNKGAYLVGSLRYAGSAWPVVLPILVDDEHKLYVDTLICDEDELSVVFSYTRSYFMVDAPHPYALVDYLNALLPGKKRSELYAAIGMHKHGKTEFYRGFLTHLARSKDQFQIAPGIKGMVMTVFTLPSYQTVQDHQGPVRAAEGHHARSGEGEILRRQNARSRRAHGRHAGFIRLRCRARVFTGN
jgi:isocitrate dehydrogenase kinase/phosphatase